MNKKLKDVVIVNHSYTLTSLVEEELLSYLLLKTRNILYITHPFKQSRDNVGLNTKVRVYSNGNFLREMKFFSGLGPEAIFFVKDFFFNIFYLLFQKRKIDVFFGFDNLDVFSGIILKKLGRVEKVVYYVIDYVPKRFNNPLLNNLYHWADLYCVKNADQTWNLSDEMERARLKDGLQSKYSSKQITVPVGCHPVKARVNNKNEKKIVFLGILSKDQGVSLLIKSMPEIVKSVPSVSLLIIGSGPEGQQLKEMVRRLKLNNRVKFTGFVQSNKEVNNLLINCSIGVAPYVLSKTSFKYYTDPGKIKTYLGAGLPVVMTNISHIAKVINDEKAGLVIKDNKKNIADAIIMIFSNSEFYSKLRNNAIKLSKEFSWESIFYSAFRKL